MGATYDPANIVAVLGVIPFTGGYAKGTFLSIEQTEDSYSIQVGSTGEVCRTRNNNRSGMATVTMMGSSLINDACSAFMELDRLTNAGVAPFLMKDLNSLGLSSAPNGWFKKPPKYDFSDGDMPNREWPIQLDDVDMFIGGQLT